MKGSESDTKSSNLAGPIGLQSAVKAAYGTWSAG